MHALALSPVTVASMQGYTPALDLNFLTPADVLDSRITFTRSSAATRVNKSGLIESITTNNPRFDYDPVTLAARGLLIEEQRTNLSLRSDDITSPTNYSIIGGGALTRNQTAPDGTTNASLFAEGTTAASGHYLYHNSGIAVTSGTSYTQSVYIKPGTATRLQLTFGSAIFGTSQYANFGLTGSGSILASTGGTASISGPDSNGFYRCVFTATATVTTTATPFAWGFINSDTATRLPAYTGTDLTLTVWGVQFESGAFATSYIPTTSASVTRSADDAILEGSGFLSLFNFASGTYLAEFTRFGFDTGSGAVGVMQVDDGSTNNRIAMRLNNRLASATAQVIIVNGGSIIVNNVASKTTDMTGIVIKEAMAFMPTSVAIGRDGEAMVSYSVSSLPSAENRFVFGGGPGTVAIHGHFRRIRYWRSRLPDSVLQSLTA